MAEPFPWAAAMRFGLGRMCLAPRDFWAMTPRELAAAAGEGARPHPTRTWLDAQAALFPDRPTEGGTDDRIR